VAADLCGVHAQISSAAELALADRVDGLGPGRVGELIDPQRALVKTWAMRGTLHLFAADDLPLWVAALQTRVAYRKPYWQRGFKVTLAQMEALMEAVSQALDGRVLTREELDTEVARLTDGSLAGRLRSGWGELLKPAAYEGRLCFGPPRGRHVTFARPDQWVPGWRPWKGSPEEAVEEVARRYLHVYGPASHEHFAAWWGIDAAEGRRVFARLGDELVELDLDGERVQAVAADLDGIEAAGSPPPHVRLLGHFDPFEVGVRPRSLFVPDAFYDRVYLKAGWMAPVVLVAGRAVGTWAAEKQGRRTVVTASPFEKFGRTTQTGIRREAERLAPFLGEAVTVEVRAS
jgi:DNA glycosylase AlkZ-like